MAVQHKYRERFSQSFPRNKFGARFYDAVIGRFMSFDPLAKKYAAWSGYSYTFDNPVHFIDPTGKGPEDNAFLQAVKSVFLAEGKAIDMLVHGTMGSAKNREYEGNGSNQNGGTHIATKEQGQDPTKAKANNADYLSDSKGYFIKNVTGYTADFKPTNPVELLQRVIDFKTKTDDLKDAMGANPDNKKDEKEASTKPASDADGSNAAQKPTQSQISVEADKVDHRIDSFSGPIPILNDKGQTVGYRPDTLVPISPK